MEVGKVGFSEYQVSIIDIQVLCWGSKSVIVSLNHNDSKSRPHAVPGSTCWQHYLLAALLSRSNHQSDLCFINFAD